MNNHDLMFMSSTVFTAHRIRDTGEEIWYPADISCFSFQGLMGNFRKGTRFVQVNVCLFSLSQAVIGYKQVRTDHSGRQN